MNLTKKISQILALIFLVSPLLSCTSGCVEPDEFDAQTLTIEAKPGQIYGSYNPLTGGQRVDWDDPSLRSNGDMFLMTVSGTWTSLHGVGMNDTGLNQLPVCTTCAKRTGVPNCICYSGQTPTAERDNSGQLYTKASDGITNLNCASSASDQDDPVRCSCTTQHGLATAYGVYHISLNLLNKDETTKKADDQSNCRFTQGIGAYVSLWGNRGVTTPKRAYHLFSEEQTCPIVRNSQNKCIDENGRDRTAWIFRSANSRIFMKDDQSGNDGSDTNTIDDIYHNGNEALKDVMYDKYYSDNYGRYNLTILRGVGSAREIGLLEYVVRIVEDKLLGPIGEDGFRTGGIIKFMYLAVVKDTGFAAIVQISLALYIALFGAASLWGLVEMNKKEITSRMLKIGLVMFFISPSSWEFYNEFIVRFFMDGMNSLIGIIMDNVDSNIDPNSMIITTQMDRANDASSATRFSYVDEIIRKLMSEATAKKIVALFFSDFFGVLYIIVIYALIGYFIFVMLWIATKYIANLIKIIFVLALGPIFIVFTLFSKTTDYFRNWLGYLGGRSFEMIILFTILYLFITLIDKNFTEMLGYRVCGYSWGIDRYKHIMTIFRTSGLDRTLPQWLFYFGSIAGFITVTQLLIDKVPTLASALFTINIAGGKSQGGFAAKPGDSDFYSAKGMRYGKSGLLNAALGVAKSAVTGIEVPGTGGAKVGLAPMFSWGMNNVVNPVARASGAAGVWSAFKDKTGLGAAYNFAEKYAPIPLPPSRSNMIDDVIKNAQKAGFSGNKLRDKVMEEMQAKIKADPTKMAALGLDAKTVNDRLDRKLLQEPLQAQLKIEAKKMKEEGRALFGKDAQDYLKGKLIEWAGEQHFSKGQYLDNISGGSAAAAKYLDGKDFAKLMDKEASFSAAEAKKAFGGDKLKEGAFRQHLADKEFKDKDKWGSSLSGLMGGGMSKEEKREAMLDYLRGNEVNDKKRDYFQGKLREMAQDEARKMMKGESLLIARDKVLDSLTRQDGKSLFEKTAMLTEMNKKMGLGGRDSQADLANMLRREKGVGMFDESTSADMAKRLQNATGEQGKANDAIRELQRQREHDEALARVAQGEKEAAANLMKTEEDLKKSQQEKEALGKAADDAAKATSKEEVASFIPTEFKFDFGASIGDALMKEADVGLHAGNVLLGVAKGKDGSVDPSVLMSMKINSNQLHSKMTLGRIDLQIKTIELDQAKKAGNKDETARLEKEIVDLSKEMSARELALDKLDGQIADLSK
ncbi:MAG: hypothetical protein FJX34_04585 [Alphaproteobacteria bacterium]|nr:hypothetical protein [Alphaproteobacteria bacterium]